jgi:hypothetical protein
MYICDIAWRADKFVEISNQYRWHHYLFHDKFDNTENTLCR